MYAMWSTYAPEHASCIISPFVQYTINDNLKYENNTLEFNTTCLQLFDDNDRYYTSTPLRCGIFCYANIMTIINLHNNSKRT
ncbi:hypothetical protein NQ317_005351 [Molorchus minor]|uniref:Uncharacterized protein n=1 Tax=Molorchus minor TaxID=1323400 RepID=A0ABQ9JNU3_9CUCU|nr:hypothetical protein NQ317_005351 [Molorchus minor]